MILPSENSRKSRRKHEFCRALAQYQKALAAQNGDRNAVSTRSFALDYGVPTSTFDDRASGRTVSRKEVGERQQRLRPGEEQATVDWILRLGTWGWPPRVEHVRFMVEDLLQKKGDNSKLGKNYMEKFNKRHPDLKVKYVPPIDNQRQKL